MPLHLHPHPNPKSERTIGEAIINLNENNLVEINDGTTGGTKKYRTPEGKIIYGPFVWPENDDDREEVSDEEAAELMAYLDRCKEEDPPEPLSLEQMIEDSRQSYSQIDMFDYGTGKMSNQQAIADFYGWAIVKKIQHEIEYSYEHKLKDQKPGHISKQLWQQMKDIRAGRLPKADTVKYENQCKPKTEKPILPPDKKSEPTKSKSKKKPEIKIEKRERQKGDDYFLPLERGIIRNETYRKLFKGPGVVYEWLWVNIVRDQWRDSKAYPIKEKYYDKGYLAYCSTYRKIAKDCGMSKNTVHAYIMNFEKAGIVKTKSHIPDGKTQEQTVFILGTWKKVNGEIVESYFRESVFITPKAVKN